MAGGLELAPVGEGQRLRLQVGGRGGLVEAAGAPDIRLHGLGIGKTAEIGAQRRAAGLEGGEHLLEGTEVQRHGEAGIGPADGPGGIGFSRQGDGAPGLGRDRPRGLVLQHFEVRRDPRFQREAVQQLLAEGVDGLDLQSARRLQGQGEEAAGLAQVGDVFADLGQFLPERRVGHHRPAAQGLEQPPLHLGRGRLGVGDAEDGLGLGPAQQQPRHAVHQGPGLARPGIGRDEGRGCWLRRQDLGIEDTHKRPSPLEGQGSREGGRIGVRPLAPNRKPQLGKSKRKALRGPPPLAPPPRWGRGDGRQWLIRSPPRPRR